FTRSRYRLRTSWRGFMARMSTACTKTCRLSKHRGERASLPPISPHRLDRGSLDAHTLRNYAVPAIRARCEGWSRGRGVARDRRAAHDPRVLRSVPRAAAMEDAAVVPHHQVPLLPAMRIGGA